MHTTPPRKATQQRAVYLILAAVIAVLNVALSASLFTSPLSQAIVWGSLILCIGMVLGIIWLIWHTVTKPVERLAAISRTLATQDSAALTGALAALAQGDLTVRLDILSQPLTLSTGSILDPVIEPINTVITHLQESGRELNTVTDEPCLRLFYVGPDAYLEGQVCGDIMGEAMGGRGQVAVFTLAASTCMELRRKGFQNRLREKYPSIQVVEVIETSFTPEKSYADSKDLLRRYRALTAIYLTEGISTPGVAKAVVEAGQTGHVRIACHDMVDDTMRYVQQGVVMATVGQDPFAQGYEPVINLFNHLVTGWLPEKPRLLTHIDVVTADNYQQFWLPGRGVIESELTAARRTRPLQRSPKPLRIGVIFGQTNEFWDVIAQGIQAAAEVLRPYNAAVEAIIPEASRGRGVVPTDAPVFGPAIEELVAQGYDAISVTISDGATVPYINRAVLAGVPVALFNSEPVSLRGLMNMLIARSQTLASVSRGLANTDGQTGAATDQDAKSLFQTAPEATTTVDRTARSIERIGHNIGIVAQGTEEQTQAAGNVSAAFEQISRAVQMAVETTNTVAATAAQSSSVAQHGAETVQQALQQIESIQTTVSSAASVIKEMSSYSRQIGAIIETIEDIAAQTNLLALNATIEAARAGEKGHGFAVVAEEVRKLAKSSAAATKQVTTIIRTVQNSIASADKSVDAAFQRAQVGSSLAAASGEALQKLVDGAAAVQEQTHTLVQANQGMLRDMDRLTESIERVSVVIEKNIAATEAVTTEIHQAFDLIEEVGRSATDLAVIAQELQVATVMFKIDGELAGNDPPTQS